MTTTDSFLPDPDSGAADGPANEIAAADPGAGAPEPAEGFGVEGEEPDRAAGDADPDTGPDDRDTGTTDTDTPFRTPVPPSSRPQDRARGPASVNRRTRG
jgi:hypothetical protein